MSYNFRLSPNFLCDVVWRQIFENIEVELPEARRRIEDNIAACERTRAGMEYNTGSISLASALSLYALVRFVRPQTIFEIGTFIGRSTLSMAAAIDMNGNEGRIYTCDGSNEARLPLEKVKCAITTYSKTMSHDALNKFAQENRQIDLLHIDGRISAADMEIISRTTSPRAIYALDDFEGIEKGVANWGLMRSNPFFARHSLVYPADPKLIDQSSGGVVGRSITALAVPMESFRFSVQ